MFTREETGPWQSSAHYSWGCKCSLLTLQMIFLYQSENVTSGFSYHIAIIKHVKQRCRLFYNLYLQKPVLHIMFWPDIHVQLMIQTFVSLSELIFLTALGLHVDSWAPLCPDKIWLMINSVSSQFKINPHRQSPIYCQCSISRLLYILTMLSSLFCDIRAAFIISAA